MSHNSLLIFTNLITPYRIEFFNEIQNILGKNNFHAIFLYRRFGVHPWSIPDREIMFRHCFVNEDFGTFVNPVRLCRIILKQDFNYAMIAGLSISAIIVFIISKIKRAKTFHWSEEREKPTSLVRLAVRKAFLKQFDMIIPISTRSQKYFVDCYSIPKAKTKVILQAPFLEGKCQQRRIRFSMVVKLLYIGRLEEYKHIDFLLDVISSMDKELRKRISLTIIGSGSKENYLKNIVKERNLSPFVSFLGYLTDREEIQRSYLGHDVFFIASHEPFGVVLVEAASKGLALLASSEVGAVDDIIINGANGYIFDHLNLGDCVVKLSRLVKNRALLEGMKRRSFEHVAMFSAKKLSQDLFEIMK